MKMKIALFGLGLTVMLAACGNESEEAKEVKQEAPQEVVEDKGAVEEQEVAAPRETLDVQETVDLIEDGLKKIQSFSGTLEIIEDRTLAGVQTQTEANITFKDEYGDAIKNEVKGTEKKSVDGQTTESDVHRFTVKEGDQYVYNVTTDQYEIREFSFSDYAYKMATSSPWQNTSSYFGFEDAYNAATVAEQDDKFIYLTTDLSYEGLARLAQTFLYKVHLLDDASQISRYPEFSIKEGTYTIKVDRETKQFLTIEWDFIMEGKNYIDETMYLDHYSSYIVETVNSDLTFDVPQELMDNAVNMKK